MENNIKLYEVEVDDNHIELIEATTKEEATKKALDMGYEIVFCTIEINPDTFEPAIQEKVETGGCSEMINKINEVLKSNDIALTITKNIEGLETEVVNDSIVFDDFIMQFKVKDKIYTIELLGQTNETEVYYTGVYITDDCNKSYIGIYI